MGNGTPNEYYALAVWKLKALKDELDEMKYNTPSKGQFDILCEIIFDVIGATNAFYSEHVNDISELNNKIECHKNATIGNEQAELLALESHISELELRVSVLEERRKYKPRIKPSKACFRRS